MFVNGFNYIKKFSFIWALLRGAPAAGDGQSSLFNIIWGESSI